MNRTNYFFRKLSGSELIYGECLRDTVKILNQCDTLCQQEETNCNEIISGLWLGNQHIALDETFINEQLILSVVNITDCVPNNFSHINYIHFPIKDCQACESKETSIQILKQGAEFVNQELKKGQNVLVHCKKGHHRSACIIAFYLMIYHRMSLIDAVRLIKKVRPSAFKRMTCLLQILLQIEKKRIMGKYYLV